MKKKVIIIIFIVVLLLCYYLYFENTELQVSNYNIVNSKIPDEFNDFKIVQISDFHNNKSNKLTNDLVEEIKKQKPNIVVITGDFIDSRKTNVDVAIDFVKRIKEVAPIYFVTGNHEASTGKYEELRSELVKNNVNILDNKCEVIQRGKFNINLVGIDDPSMYYHPEVSDGNIVNDLINSMDYDKENFSILLSHRPELLDTYVENGIDLVLTGHAHGGQVRIPFIGGLVAPNQGIFPKYTGGKVEKNKTTMIISRGIGNSIIPFRINNRPEMIVIELNI